MAGLIGKLAQGVSAGIGLAGEKYQDHKERKAALAEQSRGESSRVPQDHENVTTSEVEEKTHENKETADDERIWALDEAAGPPPSYDSAVIDLEQTIAELAYTVAESKSHQTQIHNGEVSRLAYPVIIPQRRPGSKERGWTRAYAPDLEPLGIDQDTFMKFLGSWDKAAQGSAWFRAVSITANVVGLVPSPIIMAVTTAVTVAAETGYELHGRSKANAFLDQMNRDVFMPAGLYAMVMICKQDASITGGMQLDMETVNLENAKTVSKWGIPGDDPASTSKFNRSIRIASGKSNVDEMPLEIAPLIYPGLDDMLNRPELKRDESFKERMMRNKDFVADYFDRRAQANFSGNNPDTALAQAHGEVPEFKNRFADPNNACNNGHLVSLVTGGKVVMQGRGLLGTGGAGGRRDGRGAGGRRDGRGRGGLLGGVFAAAAGRQESGVVDGSGRRTTDEPNTHESIFAGRRGGSSSGIGSHFDQRRQTRGSQFREVGEDGKLLPKAKQPERQPRGPIGYVMKGVKKVLKPDVMYLTIVNLPTDEEMEMAREALNMDKKSWQEIIAGMRRR